MSGSELFFGCLLVSIVPALIWLSFWLKEDEQNPEPRGFIVLAFLGGMMAVFIASFFEHATKGMFPSNQTTFLWAGIEEIVKLIIFMLIVAPSQYLDEPIDPPIYMITIALGFAALENGLFLIDTLSNGNLADGVIAQSLRFIGASLLHVIASGMIGMSIGMAFFGTPLKKAIMMVVGLILAILLHSLFNFSILDGNGKNIFQVFSIVWVVGIIMLLLFEKVKQIGRSYLPVTAPTQ